MADHVPSAVEVILSGAPAVRDPGNVPAMLRLARRISALNPDILHMQSGLVWEQLMFAACAVPKVLTIHDVTRHPTRTLLGGTPQWLLDIPARLADGLIVHGETLRATALSRFGKSKPVAVVNHPVIRRYGGGQARREPGRNVLFFGTMDEWKGLEYLAAAIPAIRASLPEANFIVAGGASDKAYYDGVFAGHKVDLRIRRQSEADVAEIFRWADVLVMPYVEASQSGVLHLAISYGLPIVASRVGGLFDVLTHEQTGLAVEPRDAVGLASAVVRALSDASLRQRLIDGVCALRDGALAPSVIAGNTLALYHQVLGKSQC